MARKPTRRASIGRLANLKAGYPMKGKDGKVTVRSKPTRPSSKRSVMSKSDSESIQDRLKMERAMGVKRGGFAKRRGGR